MTIDEDASTVTATDNTVTIVNTASRNASCDSAVSVSSEVDLIIASEGDRYGDIASDAHLFPWLLYVST